MGLYDFVNIAACYFIPSFNNDDSKLRQSIFVFAWVVYIVRFEV